MGTVKIFGLLVLLLGLSSLSFSAACASKAYDAACQKCPFDSSGKLDQKCYEGYQGSGVACLFAAYPVESIQYKMGGCKAVDTCIDRLNTCKAIASSGNDRSDCAYGEIDHCFDNADVCVDKAIKNCDEDPPEQITDVIPPAGWCDGFFFLFIPLAAGVLAYSRKN